MIELPAGAERNPRLAAMAAQTSGGPSTQIGIGVVSLNTVDAAVELAQEHDVSLMLIASRRQVDAAELGGGYVDGLTPQALCERVRTADARDRVVVCRDHGGPWQGSSGYAASPEQAMEEARLSFLADLDAGFDLLHIDTSPSPPGDPGGPGAARTRMLELYDDCWRAAQERGRAIAFEVGDEEQASVAEGLEQPDALLTALAAQRADTGAPPPLFVVVQTGTKVMERRNVGSLSAPYRIDGQMPPQIHLPQVMALVRGHGTHLRQHNTDYLPTEILEWHPLLGIHAANIAPEYGVEESLGLLALMEGRGAHDLSEAFLTLAYDTRKWEKWELQGTDATDRDRAVWAGHYVFSTPEFGEIRGRLMDRAGLTSDALDRHLRDRVKASILRHLRAFRLVP
ncbi:MAG TPA: class II D-tagatose-bisphosphate aldolase, non-catalytic subunit [Baekduia sp.]|nr:class II D-tagatose-bisphosphate aldolase, non-catalytic subunit [Baekduia sp.]